MKVTKKFVNWEGMCWPRHTEDENDSVQWRLRYGQPSKEDLLFAASVMNAYGCLVECTDKKRREVVSTLRSVKDQP